MAYIRKTADEYQIHQFTGDFWEEVCAESTWREAKNRLREYRANQPEFPVKVKYRRIKKESIK